MVSYGIVWYRAFDLYFFRSVTLCCAFFCLFAIVWYYADFVAVCGLFAFLGICLARSSFLVVFLFDLFRLFWFASF